MFSFMTTADGGLTTAGYIICIIGTILIFLAGVYLPGRKAAGARTAKAMSAKRLCFCAMGVALAFVTSYIKLFKFPYGGSMTLCSMLFIVLIANWYGVKTGILVGFAYGLLQFLQEPYVLSPFQVCCDYVFAFAALGLAGVFSKSKNGLIKGYILAVLARGVFHTLGGYLYWMDYIPDKFPKSLTILYPVIYNYTYLLTEGVLTVILLAIPPIRKAFNYVKRLALEP